MLNYLLQFLTPFNIATVLMISQKNFSTVGERLHKIIKKIIIVAAVELRFAFVPATCRTVLLYFLFRFLFTQKLQPG